MSVNTKALEALDVKKLPQFPGLPVIGLEVEDYTDWTGDPALRVTVILDDSMDEEKVTGEAVGDLKRAIRQMLRDRGITLFAYMDLVKPSELAESDEE